MPSNYTKKIGEGLLRQVRYSNVRNFLSILEGCFLRNPKTSPQEGSEFLVYDYRNLLRFVVGTCNKNENSCLTN